MPTLISSFVSTPSKLVLVTLSKQTSEDYNGLKLSTDRIPLIIKEGDIEYKIKAYVSAFYLVWYFPQKGYFVGTPLSSKWHDQCHSIYLFCHPERSRGISDYENINSCPKQSKCYNSNFWRKWRWNSCWRSYIRFIYFVIPSVVEGSRIMLVELKHYIIKSAQSTTKLNFAFGQRKKKTIANCDCWNIKRGKSFYLVYLLNIFC